jgi:L-histidine N-alpha-methyltransferase
MTRPFFSSAPIEQREFATAVREGLGKHSQKTLESKYLYDAIGSALFDVITLLPEYGVTRADERLIQRHAAEIANRIKPGAVVVELGSGSGTKTRRILASLTRKGPITYRPIDVSALALARCCRDVQDISGIHVETLQHSYIDGLKRAIEATPQSQQLLLLFLGGTIGNFARDAITPFFRRLRALLREGDTFLLGADLEKPISQLLPAYDDSIGVTAAFNLNLLERINRELGGNIDVDQFEHVARYDKANRRIEMHLRSRCPQQARVLAAGLDVTFQRGETIWTESSHKFNVDELSDFSQNAGFRCAAQWIDQDWPFAEALLIAE